MESFVPQLFSVYITLLKPSTLKKVLFFLLKALSILLLFGLGALALFTYHLETGIDTLMTKEQQEAMFTEIKNTEPLPEKYYETIEKYYPGYFNTNFWETAFKALILPDHGDRLECQCMNLTYVNQSYRYFSNESFFKSYRIGVPIITLAIEERFTERECFAYIMNRTYYDYQTTGVEQAAMCFFEKSLEELTEEEILSLHIMRKAPATYNPKRNPKRLKDTIKETIRRHGVENL